MKKLLLSQTKFKEYIAKIWVAKKLSAVSNPYEPLDKNQRHHQLVEVEIQLYDTFFKKPLVYLLAKDLSGSLATVNLKIPVKHLKCTDPILIEFPENTNVSDSAGEFSECAFCWQIDDRIIFNCPLYDKNGKWTGECDWVGVNLSLPTIEEIIRYTIDQSTHPLSEHKLRYLLNCLVYIHSGNPDFRLAKAKKMNASQGKEYYKKHPDEIPFDYFKVGYGWLKPHIFNVDSTTVSGHFRWQPCGKDLCDVKLIFINQHIRNYTNNKTEVQNEEI